MQTATSPIHQPGGQQQVAIVTGASRGIGRAIAVALAAAGCKARRPGEWCGLRAPMPSR